MTVFSCIFNRLKRIRNNIFNPRTMFAATCKRPNFVNGRPENVDEIRTRPLCPESKHTRLVVTTCVLWAVFVIIIIYGGGGGTRTIQNRPGES